MNKSASEQQQFLNVIDRDEAERRWRATFSTSDAQGTEMVPVSEALGRLLAEPIASEVDVPFFDRSNLDGFAVRAVDTYGADEEQPLRLQLLPEVIATAVVPKTEVELGQAVTIATGGMLPRGADAIVMVEHTEVETDQSGDWVKVSKAVTPGRGVSFAGTDIAKGETVYQRGVRLTSRETGVLAAIGCSKVPVFRKPIVGILSTGDEIIDPSQPMRPGMVYDSNAQVLADAVRELGGEPLRFGIVSDDQDQLRKTLENAIEQCDVVLMSGGTSKGAGDISYQVVREFTDPGIVAHGIALKPGKPICLAATRGKPVVILPGFPTSAIFTFHEFVSSVIKEMAGGQPTSFVDGNSLAKPAIGQLRGQSAAKTVTAELATQVNSEIGRTEYLLVGIVKSDEKLVAFPMGKGSGSVTTFARADGFVTIDRHCEIVDEGSQVNVTLMGSDLAFADLVVMGSHCVGLDYLLGELQATGLTTKFLAVGSTAGLRAVKRGECDLAGIHLLDPDSNTYNQPFLSDGLELVRGYTRRQGIVFRNNDARFAGKSLEDIQELVVSDPDCVMVNRNQGSGTRILIDGFLQGSQPTGYAVQSRSHNAVAASISQGEAIGELPSTWPLSNMALGFCTCETKSMTLSCEVRTGEPESACCVSS